jgi:hypothetical protein
MFDYDAIRDAALTKVATAMARCHDGVYGLERGAKARHLLAEEAEELTRRAIRDQFRFEPTELPTYLATIPKLLDTFVDERGDLRDLIDGAVRTRLFHSIIADVFDQLLAPRKADTAEDMLATIETTLEEDLDPIPQFHGSRLRRLIAECRAEPCIETVVALVSELRREASDLRTLAHRLDIADPPTAAYAIRGSRRLLEAATLYRLNHEFDLVEDFCNAPPLDAAISGATP